MKREVSVKWMPPLNYNKKTSNTKLGLIGKHGLILNVLNMVLIQSVIYCMPSSFGIKEKPFSKSSSVGV